MYGPLLHVHLLLYPFCFPPSSRFMKAQKTSVVFTQTKEAQKWEGTDWWFWYHLQLLTTEMQITAQSTELNCSTFWNSALKSSSHLPIQWWWKMLQHPELTRTWGLGPTGTHRREH